MNKYHLKVLYLTSSKVQGEMDQSYRAEVVAHGFHTSNGVYAFYKISDNNQYKSTVACYPLNCTIITSIEKIKE